MGKDGVLLNRYKNLRYIWHPSYDLKTTLKFFKKKSLQMENAQRIV